MTRHFRSTNVVVTFFLVLSMALAALATTAQAAGARHAAKKNVPNGKACKTRNKATGTIKFSDWQFPDTLNGAQSSLAVTQEVLNGMFDGLFATNDKAKLIPDVASVVPSVKNGGIKNGGKTIIIHIKPGQYWSNGALLTSKDLKFGWQIGMDPVSGPACKGSCDIISRIDTPDRYTAVLHLKQIYAPVLYFGMPSLWPTKWAGAWNNDAHAAAQKLYQDTQFNFEGPNFPTNGPYQVQQFVNNDRIVLTPMKHYTSLNCGAQVKQLIFAFYSSKPALIAAAASRGTDLTQDYTIADVPELAKHTGYKLHQDPAFIVEHLELNLDATYHGQPNPTANANVRLALALALDKVGLIRSALGISTAQAKNIIAWTPLTKTPQLVQPFADKSVNGQWDPLQKKYVIPGSGKALADAKKLLAKTPYKNGFNLDLVTTSGNPVRQAQVAVITQNWSRLGVKVVPNYFPASKLFADFSKGGTVTTGEYQVGMWGYQGQADPDQWKFNMQSKFCDRKQAVHSAVNGNDACIQDPKIDKAFDVAAHTFNSKIRQKNYSFMQSQMNQKAYWVELYYRPFVWTSNSQIINAKGNPTQFGPTWNMFEWRAKAS